MENLENSGKTQGISFGIQGGHPVIKCYVKVPALRE